MSTVSFYKPQCPFGVLSNFTMHAIVLDQKVWPSTEHYFQAQKFATTEPDYTELIRAASSCRIAATLGRARGHTVRPRWETLKFYIMQNGLYAKFTQHDDARAVLLATGDAVILEDTGQGPDDDHVWGVGSSGTGANLLGVGLMAVRTAIREQDREFHARIRRAIDTIEGVVTPSMG
jgi:ribA/ribD-fused uncharacterized protein